MHYSVFVIAPRGKARKEPTREEVIAKAKRLLNRRDVQCYWDWYQLGGRYTGALDPGYDPEQDPANIEDCHLCGQTGRRKDTVGVEIETAILLRQAQEQGRVDPDDWEAAQKRTQSDRLSTRAVELRGISRKLNDLIDECMAQAAKTGMVCNGCGGKGRAVKWPTQWSQHDKDVRPIAEVLALPKVPVPYAVITPEAEWVETGGWKEEDRKDEAFIRGILEKYPDGYVCAFDLHN